MSGLVSPLVGGVGMGVGMLSPLVGGATGAAGVLSPLVVGMFGVTSPLVGVSTNELLLLELLPHPPVVRSANTASAITNRHKDFLVFTGYNLLQNSSILFMDSLRVSID